MEGDYDLCSPLWHSFALGVESMQVLQASRVKASYIELWKSGVRNDFLYLSKETRSTLTYLALSMGNCESALAYFGSSFTSRMSYMHSRVPWNFSHSSWLQWGTLGSAPTPLSLELQVTDG